MDILQSGLGKPVAVLLAPVDESLLYLVNISTEVVLVIVITPAKIFPHPTALPSLPYPPPRSSRVRTVAGLCGLGLLLVALLPYCVKYCVVDEAFPDEWAEHEDWCDGDDDCC